jgi:hypothetical protein
MILDPEEWMDLRRFRALYEAGVSISATAPERLKPAHFGNSAKLAAGDIVLAMGNPWA